MRRNEKLKSRTRCQPVCNCKYNERKFNKQGKNTTSVANFDGGQAEWIGGGDDVLHMRSILKERKR
jgi:hypothetical protein